MLSESGIYYLGPKTISEINNSMSRFGDIF